MRVAGELHVHLLHHVQQVPQHMQHVHRLRPQPCLGRLHVLTGPGHALAQSLDLLLQVATHRGIQLLPHHQIEVATSGLVQIIHGRESCGSA